MNLPPENLRPQENTEEEKTMICQKAIDIYLRAIYEYSRLEISPEIDKDIKDKAVANQGRLDAGCRFGAPGHLHTKLYLDFEVDPNTKKPVFFISSNGMEKKPFLEWQYYIGKKFEANGLILQYRQE